MKEPVDQDRTIGGYTDGRIHVKRHRFIVVHDLHAAAAQNIGRAHHDRVADAVGNFKSFLHRGRHAALRHRDLKPIHQLTEQIAVFGEIDHFRCCAENVHAVLFQLSGKVQRRLPAELRDHADRLFLVVDAQNILDRQGFKIELVGGVVIGGNGFRVAVDDNRFKAERFQRLGGMYAAVVEFDPLTDPVRTAAEDHDFRTVARRRAFVLHVVARKVIGGVFRAADVNAFPGFGDAEAGAGGPDLRFRQAEQLCKVLVGKTVLLGGTEHIFRRDLPGVCLQRFFLFHKLLHLRQEPAIDLGQAVKRLNIGALAQRFIQNKLAFAGGNVQHRKQFLFRFAAKVLCTAQTRTPRLKAADCFLKRFLVRFADAHDFTDRAHLRAQLIFGAFEFFKRPAGKFDNDVIAGRNVFIQRSALSAGDFVQRQPAGQHCRNKRNREAGRLACQRGGAGGAGINFDDNDAVGNRIVRKLHVRSADDADIFHDLIGLILQPALHRRRNGEHRRGAEGIAGVDAHRIDIFDEADGNHIALCVADNLQLKLFPAENGFFH